MKKDKVTMFAEESYNDLDDNIGIVMPILTDCDVDEDFYRRYGKGGGGIAHSSASEYGSVSGRSYANWR